MTTTLTRRRAKLPLLRPTVSQVDTLFSAFADPTRIRILNVLAAGELCVCDIVALLRVPQPTVSRHLTTLRRAGLIDVTRRWKYVHCRLTPPSSAVHGTLAECVRSCFSGISSLDRERNAASARVAARAENPCS